MDVKNELLIIKEEDKTYSVKSLRFDEYEPLAYVTYGNGSTYTYKSQDVKYFTSPHTVLEDGFIICKKDVILSDAKKIQIFGDYCRILYKDLHTETERINEVKIVRSALDKDEQKKRFEYLKELSSHIGLALQGRNILLSHYNNISFVRDDSVLAFYLQGEIPPSSDNAHSIPVIFPFGFNLSQKQAVENAMNNLISIIEGPPGTGKTQTILNIISNAVIRGESVAVVSNNNTATANVFEKLKKYGVDFIAAPLGNTQNKEVFIESQNPALPETNDPQNQNINIHDILKDEQLLNEKLRLKNELAAAMAEKNLVTKEYKHFCDYFDLLEKVKDVPSFKNRITSAKILLFIAEYEIKASENNKIGLFSKLMWKFRYGLKNLRFLNSTSEQIIAHCYNIYYKTRLSETENRISLLEATLDEFDFDKKMAHYTELSISFFKQNLANKYRGVTRKMYTAQDLYRNSKKFVSDYPVILSTTYSLRSSLSKEFVYDYVIIDEASQVDIVTGALALSCGKKAVIVGDTKQLPNIVNKTDRIITDDIFLKYRLSDAYNFSQNSLLSSFIALFPDAPRVLLREHYRCHPEIIGFCNQRFYNNELVIMTHSANDIPPLAVYRTASGNHARGHINRRQIDVITDEVFPQLNLDKYDDSVGIVTPYRDQANELQKVFSDSSVKADTADKFQGQEKSVIIFSTVDNEIGEFASHPNRLNVAVSRAINQFIVVTDGNGNDNASPIHDLIGYIEYCNHDIVHSKIHSVFDYLYKNYDDARQKILKKHSRISEFESENLMHHAICKILSNEKYQKYDVASHVPLRMILNELDKLDTRELSFVTNQFSHVDFLIFSKLTHQPLIAIEVDGHSYHSNEKQKERDSVKDSVFKKYGIPLLRFPTTGSEEEKRIREALDELSKSNSSNV